MEQIDYLQLSLSTLPKLVKVKSRSISAENFTGEKGGGGKAISGTGAKYAKDLGIGWKISPSIEIKSGETFTIANILGPGIIQSMWFGGYIGKNFILRIYWDDQGAPSVETPLCDFFGLPWITHQEFGTNGPLVRLNSLPVCVNPNRGLNCFWQMPFKKQCRVTLENLHPEKALPCFYQINYALCEVPNDIGYFHAQFRQVNPLPYKEVFTILNNVSGQGQYVGTSMGWSINNNGWWGEGEIKFYLDGDKDFPTICGTGVEDYFGGSFDWDVSGEYIEYSTPFLGMHQVIRPDGYYHSQHRHAMYRWHVMDPIYFKEDIRVTIQALGWRPDDGSSNERRYLPGQHRILSVAYWYQKLPTLVFPKFPTRDELEIV